MNGCRAASHLATFTGSFLSLRRAVNVLLILNILILGVVAGPCPLRTHIIVRYGTERYPFAAVLQRDLFRVPRLELLHEHYIAAGR